MERYFTPTEFAQAFGFTPRTVYALVKSGKLRAVHFGRSIRIPASAVDEFTRQGKAVAKQDV